MKQVLSTLMAIVLMLTGCGGAASSPNAPDRGGSSRIGGGTEAVKMSYALSEPVYPEFPQQPVMPEEGPEGGWDAYREKYDRYIEALQALRGDNPNLSEGELSALNTFAAKSTPLAMAGHEGENAVYSPLSLWSALAMLAQCADGDSRQQVLEAMNAAGTEQLQEEVSHIWRTLYTDDGLSSLILGNSIWLSSAMEGTYVQETLDILAQKYYAGAYAVPMGTGEADQAVTDWVRKQTSGLIGGGAPVVRTQADTLALLASSLYYRAAWTEEFDPERTEEDVFTDASGKESRVDFMHKTQDALFLRRDGWQAARLNTRLGEMVFVLPDEGVSPESLLRDPDFLPGLDFSLWLDYPSPEDAAKEPIYGEIRWSVPKFDVNSGLDLKEALAAMGVTDLLDPDKADLSALTDLDAFLSDAKQLARVKVDEDGVEAAAVTIMLVRNTSLPPEPTDVCVMDLDRPFLFVIRTHQGVPLFVGVVNQVQ